MLLLQEKDGFFRKSVPNSNFHKNVFLGLAYFHAQLGSRKRYGPLGWQRPYSFDQGDFEVGLLQLKDALKHEAKNAPNGGGFQGTGPLKLLKYFYTEINYGGRIHCAEDLVLLRAMVDDLINEDTVAVGHCDEDISRGHHGFPPLGESPSYYEWLEQCVPAKDSYELLGFNWEIEQHHVRKEAKACLDALYEVNRHWSKAAEPEERPHLKLSIELSSLKSSLGSKGSINVEEYNSMMNGQGSLLKLFSSMQKLLAVSSLDASAARAGTRYDQ